MYYQMHHQKLSWYTMDGDILVIRIPGAYESGTRCRSTFFCQNLKRDSSVDLYFDVTPLPR